jgi:hypothetical protein
LSRAIEQAVCQYREIGSDRKPDTGMRRSTADAAADQGVVMPRRSAHGRDHHRAWHYNVAIHSQLRLSPRNSRHHGDRNDENEPGSGPVLFVGGHNAGSITGDGLKVRSLKGVPQ